MKCEELRLELDNKENAYLRSEERRIRLWITQIKQQIILTWKKSFSSLIPIILILSEQDFMDILYKILVFLKKTT